MIPSDSEYLPKNVCYPCHIEREFNDKIRREEPLDEHVNVFIVKSTSATNFDSLTITQFIKEGAANQLAKMHQL